MSTKRKSGQKRKIAPIAKSFEPDVCDDKQSLLRDKTTRERHSSVLMLEKALTRSNSIVSELHELEAEPHTLATQIETALFDRHRKTIVDAYDDQLRSIIFNLQKQNNGALRNALLRGEITPTTFVAMRVQDLANPELINARDSDAEWAKTIAMAKSLDTSKDTTAYTCRKCGKNKCRTSALQTRSADEGMTTFVACISCGHRWKD